MRVLIIGGTGLISTALTRRLVARGESVTVYNRGLRDVPIPESVEKMTGDRYDLTAFVPDMRRAGPFDCVVDMITYQPDEAAALVEAFQGRTAHVIFSSTIDVYQKPAVSYPYADDAPLEGVSHYGKAKAACERLLLEAHKDRGFPVTIVRPAHTYGTGGNHRGHVIHSMGKATSFLDRLRKGKPVIVHGDGSSLWASCHLEDVAAGFAGAVGKPEVAGRCYHLAADECFTWNQYHYRVAEAMGAARPELVHIPTDILVRVAPRRFQLVAENFQYNNVFDNAAAKQDLGFRQTIPFLDGMRETIRWVESEYGFDNCGDDPFYDRLIDAWRRLGGQLAAEFAGLDG